LPEAKVEKGYLILIAEWSQTNPNFTLTFSLTPRYLTPHPYSNQDIVALARGPIVYCVEDADNRWVNDHFKSLLLDIQGKIEEVTSDNEIISEPFVGLKLHHAASFLRIQDSTPPALGLDDIREESSQHVKELNFIPYALRANRGGNGQMRVGIRRKR